MHSDSGFQAGRGSPKVAVLDTIHGASIIAERMVKSGIDALALEVYHNRPSIAGFDIVVTPVHLPPSNPVLADAMSSGKRIITHHQAVGDLLSQDPKPFDIFEISGTHSKTSTALLLSKVLSSKKKVVSHTTRGIELWLDGSSRILRTGLSITPGNVVRAAEAAADNSADALICEISLGGTGLADFGILTSFSGDYRIAGGTRWASTAKLQMVSLAKEDTQIIANTDTRISSDVSFGLNGYINTDDRKIHFGSDEVPLDLGEDLDFESYSTAISASAAACYAAGMTASEVASALEGFDGFSGRMKVERYGHLTIYDSSNSGLKVSDVARALDKASGGRLGLVVGEDAETVCEGMNVPSLIELLRLRGDEIDILVLVGKRLAPLASELGAKAAPDLKAGEKLAKAEAASIDRLLLCVKCFR